MVEFVTQLAVALVLLIPIIVYWTFKPEIEQWVTHMGYETRDKKRHSQELNENFFQRLSTLTIREDVKDNYKLYVSKNKEYDSPQYSNIIYTKNDNTVIPLEKLPQPYYDWGFKHLEHKEYNDKVLKPFKKLEKLLEKYNAVETQYRETLEQKIEKELNDSFEDCTMYVKTIRRRMESELLEDPKRRFGDLIADRISQHYGIMPRGYPIQHPYIICKTITDDDLQQFKNILNSIMDSDEFLTTNKEQSKILEEINTIHRELKREFQTLSDELKAGVIISGKCKLGY